MSAALFAEERRHTQAVLEVLDRAAGAVEPTLGAELLERWARFRDWARRALEVADRLADEPVAARGMVACLQPGLARWTEALRPPSAGPGPAEGAHAGFDGFISPSRARARLDSVNAEVAAHDRAFQARRAELGDPFLTAWTSWRQSWQRFYDGYDPDWDWWYLGNASAWNETLVYQERLGQWRASAERAGARLSTPRPQSAPERRPSTWLGGARDIAIAGAIGVSVLGGVYLISKVM